MMLLLNCFADVEASETKYAKSPVSDGGTSWIMCFGLMCVVVFLFLQNPCPETQSSFLSKMLYAWFDPMALKGYRNPLEQKDLWDMNPEDQSKEVMPLFSKHWERSLAKAAGTRAYVHTLNNVLIVHFW